MTRQCRAFTAMGLRCKRVAFVQVNGLCAQHDINHPAFCSPFWLPRDIIAIPCDLSYEELAADIEKALEHEIAVKNKQAPVSRKRSLDEITLPPRKRAAFRCTF